MEDDKIIDLFWTRDQTAIEETGIKYGSRLQRLAMKILYSREDAEESVNDTYLSAWNTIPPQEPKPLLGYLCRVVRNLALKKRRDNKAQKRDSSYDAALDELAGCLAGPETAETALEAQVLTEALDRFLDGLKPSDRTLFVRRYWFGDSVPELAERWGLSRHNVTVRLSRIRQKLKQSLQKEGFYP